MRHLETNLQLGTFSFQRQNFMKVESASQTDLVYDEFVRKECNLAIGQEALLVNRQKLEEDHAQALQQITRRFNELEIKDSLLQELRVELGYKQTELN